MFLTRYPTARWCSHLTGYHASRSRCLVWLTLEWRPTCNIGRGSMEVVGLQWVRFFAANHRSFGQSIPQCWYCSMEYVSGWLCRMHSESRFARRWCTVVNGRCRTGRDDFYCPGARLALYQRPNVLAIIGHCVSRIKYPRMLSKFRPAIALVEWLSRQVGFQFVDLEYSSFMYKMPWPIIVAGYDEIYDEKHSVLYFRQRNRVPYELVVCGHRFPGWQSSTCPN